LCSVCGSKGRQTTNRGAAVPSKDIDWNDLRYASFGVSKDAWSAQIFGQNLTNVLASTFTNSSQWIEQEMVTRPRVAGVKFSYKFQ
jgi:hypothetical protein